MKYQPTYESVHQHKLPKWFDDAKFGIFVHWSLFSVPAYAAEQTRDTFHARCKLSPVVFKAQALPARRYGYAALSQFRLIRAQHRQFKAYRTAACLNCIVNRYR